ncbi:NYN domain-containing protein [Deinococcus sp. Marseille-Q6407]|uniref:LabA-like NYN domain-containing protein n=1 Tax=Deinococcus sp. Marseille-Q6407 TaxID=2969223 RepID=UPI0021BF67B1|nr:NYN domain-containing protein [Deinococcus sp. Marseille-Q6407]
MNSQRIALFVDGASIYAAAKRLGWNFDHRKVLEYFRQQGELYNAFYYTALPAQGDDKQKRFTDALTYMGYTVRTQPLREASDESGTAYRRTSLDVELVTDLLTGLEHYDTAVLISGDGGFERPLEVLRARGRRSLVVNLPEMTSYELRNASDQYLDLRDLRQEFERPGYRLPSEHRPGQSRSTPDDSLERLSYFAPAANPEKVSHEN